MKATMLQTLSAGAASALLLLASAGCAATADDLTKRESEIDAAYGRGEISFVEKEQLKGGIAEERHRRQAAFSQYMQAQQAQQAQRSEEERARWITPTNERQDVYDNSGNRVGSIRTR